jgi:hypothetical protein
MLTPWWARLFAIDLNTNRLSLQLIEGERRRLKEAKKPRGTLRRGIRSMPRKREEQTSNKLREKTEQSSLLSVPSPVKKFIHKGLDRSAEKVYACPR